MIRFQGRWCRVYLNKCVCEDLLWFAHLLNHLDGVQLFEAEEWLAEDGLGFWAPEYSSAFFGDPIIHDGLSFNIFLNEVIAILAAIHWSASLHLPPCCLAIHTDSSNPFNIFNSLHASDPYNSVLMSAALIQIDHGINRGVHAHLN